MKCLHAKFVYIISIGGSTLSAASSHGKLANVFELAVVLVENVDLPSCSGVQFCASNPKPNKLRPSSVSMRDTGFLGNCDRRWDTELLA